MRKLLAPYYSVLVVSMRSAGAVIVYTMFGKSEYLGTDKLWHRRPEHCDPFDNVTEAEAEIVKLETH